MTMENGRATTEKRIVTRKPKPVTGTTNQENQQDHMQKEDRKGENGSVTDDESDEEVVASHAHRPGRFQCELPHAGFLDLLTIPGMDYIGYFGSSFTIALTMSTLVIFVLTGMATDLWLTSWVDIEDVKSNPHTTYYLGIYIFLSLFTTFSEGITNLAFMRGSWVAARKLHSLCVRGVLNTSIGWLEKTSIGRIMGRLSSDLDSLDQNISEPLKEFLDEAFKAVMMLSAITGILPFIAAPAIVLSMVGALVGEVYSRAIKMVKNIASSAQAPVISRLSETIDGMAVIRARSENFQSAFDATIFGLLYNSARAVAAQRDCVQWLKFRMSLLSALINVVAGVLALRASGSISAGLVGFSLAQASSLSNGLLRLVFKLNELNLSMQSVCQHYI